jgi:hypothetical protein
MLHSLSRKQRWMVAQYIKSKQMESKGRCQIQPLLQFRRADNTQSEQLLKINKKKQTAIKKFKMASIREQFEVTGDENLVNGIDGCGFIGFYHRIYYKGFSQIIMSRDFWGTVII